MAAHQIGFGIIGCAEIARKMSRAILLAPSATIQAVGSRSIEKARKYAADNGYPDGVNVYGSYEAVLDDPSVDAVYLPLPTSLHLQWAVRAAEKKKHVLLEKPTALNLSDLEQILQACDSNGVQFMDGTMFVHNPRTHRIQALLSSPTLFGELRLVQSTFGFLGDSDFLENDIRVKADLDSLGALGDIGWYSIRAIMWAAGYELPKTVTALPGPVFNKEGVPLTCGASLVWEDGKTANFLCSFEFNLTMDITFFGTKGTLHMNDFGIPFQETSCGFCFSSESRFTELAIGWERSASQHVVTTEMPQEVLMVEEFANLAASIRDSGSKPDKKWPDFSRNTQLVMDAVMASLYKGCAPIDIVSLCLLITGMVHIATYKQQSCSIDL